MAKEGRTKIVNRGSGKYMRLFIYVPARVVDDTSFPFKAGDNVIVAIEQNRLVIKSAKPSQPEK